MNRLISASRSSSQFVSKAKMSINKVSHVIFDMDGLLLGKFYYSFFAVHLTVQILISYFDNFFFLSLNFFVSCGWYIQQCALC